MTAVAFTILEREEWMIDVVLLFLDLSSEERKKKMMMIDDD
jgi:hypothetical protein